MKKTIIYTKHMRFTFNIFLILGLFSSLVFSTVEPAAALFEETPNRLSERLEFDTPVIRQRLMAMNYQHLCQLEQHLSGGGESSPRILLNLFPDTELTARFYRSEQAFSGGSSLWGDIEGIPGSSVVMVVTGDIVSANISIPGHFYQVRCSAGKEGLYKIREVNQSGFPTELSPVPVQVDEIVEPDIISPDSGAYIDVMVIYTEAARNGAGGTAAMENLIDLAVSETNTGYSNSGVTQRLRLVHTAEVVYNEAGFNWSTTLSRLRGTVDGYMDDVHDWRDTYGADEVVLIVNNTASCGIAYVMQMVSTSFASNAFAVVSRICATGYYSFAHEMGHNMGCAHDRDNASVLGAYSYSYGYQAPDEAFRTIMAYNCPGNCTRVNYWSNPDKQYGGQPMGVLYTDPEAADNRRALNNTAATVANFRQAVTAPTVTVTSPNGGESLTGGSSYNIKWSHTGTVGNIHIEYTINNGSSWSTIAASTSNDGNYTWTVPNVVSSSCRVRVSEASDGSPVDTSNAVFSISSSSTSSITVISPNGGESLTAGNSYNITWSSTGTVGNVKIQYSINNGSSWSTVVSSTTNDGSYTWTVPNVDSSSCKVRISEASDGSPADTSNAVFSISSSPTSSITVILPNGGETLTAGDAYNITWGSTGTVGNVKIQLSTNSGSSWSTIVSSTSNDGSYSWTIPDKNSSSCLIKISEADDSTPSDISDAVFTISNPTPPEISLNRDQLVFGANTSGTATGSQSLLIENNGGGTLSWSISGIPSWMQVSPAAGTGPGVIAISVKDTGIGVGTYTETIDVTAAGASNSPEEVTITLKVYQTGSTTIPFGEFATPADGSTVSSSIPVTGWVLDDIDVTNVKIYNGSSYIGDAVFVEGARPDVEQAYSGYPKNYQAGWGYMMLTNFLPNGGNGIYAIIAKATDAEGNQVTLGSKTITCNNANAQKPFGALDTPIQGGTASGANFINWGWVLTPQPNNISTDGSTIKVYVDGVYLGHPKYNIYRSDIASFFPGYANSNGAAGYYSLNTGSYSNGVHTIQWAATDSGGNTDGIGSRYFTIQNTGSDSSKNKKTNTDPVNPITQNIDDLSAIPPEAMKPIKIEKGYNINSSSVLFYPDKNGTINIESKELEAMEILLNPDEYSISSGSDNKPENQQAGYTGYLVVGNKLKSLPIGSFLNENKGVFYWGPGPGFVGLYELVFIDQAQGRLRKICINILPKFIKTE